MTRTTHTNKRFARRRGFTLIELIISIGLFALVMTLVSGAYILMINLNRQVQGVATGIDNLSFALDEMTRTIRTGSAYLCEGTTDCLGAVTSFSLTDATGASVTYFLSGTTLMKTKENATSALSDPKVNITSLVFYPKGIQRAGADYQQARVKIVISGTVQSSPGKTEPFTVETGATMRGTDILP